MLYFRFLFFSCLLIHPSLHAFDHDQIGNVFVISGSATLFHRGQENIITNRAPLYSYDRIKTKEIDILEVDLWDQTTITIAPQSDMLVFKTSEDQKSLHVALMQGVVEIQTEERQLIFQSGPLQISSLYGHIEIEANRHIYMKAHRGRAEVEQAGGRTEILTPNSPLIWDAHGQRLQRKEKDSHVYSLQRPLTNITEFIRYQEKLRHTLEGIYRSYNDLEKWAQDSNININPPERLSNGDSQDLMRDLLHFLWSYTQLGTEKTEDIQELYRKEKPLSDALIRSGLVLLQRSG